MESEIKQVLEVVTKALPQSGIPCLLIGGHAVNFYGVLRATQDIDFMISAVDIEEVDRIMLDAGFTNRSQHESVTFFNAPESPLRVDFLRVDPDTMDTLNSHAQAVEYFGGYSVRVPILEDLLAMKLFAMAQGGAKREGKDFPDIVQLVILHEIPVDTKLKELCLAFATEAVYQQVHDRVSELKND